MLEDVRWWGYSFVQPPAEERSEPCRGTNVLRERFCIDAYSNLLFSFGILPALF